MKKVFEPKKNNILQQFDTQYEYKNANEMKSQATTIKKRGRRPKKILETKSEIVTNNQTSDTSNQNSAIILKLPISLPKKNMLQNTSSIHKMFRIDDDDDDYSNDSCKLSMSSSCKKCEKYEKEINELEQQIKKYEKYESGNKNSVFHTTNIAFIDINSSKEYVLNKTSIWCKWDGHPHDNIPFPIPEAYSNGIYYISGLCCCASCALAHNIKFIRDHKTDTRTTLIYQLYRELMGISSDKSLNIIIAPDKEILTVNGGTWSIELFRNKIMDGCIFKEFIRFIPPIKYHNVTIEEKNIVNDINHDNDDLIIKRSKPRVKRKTLMSTLISNK